MDKTLPKDLPITIDPEIVSGTPVPGRGCRLIHFSITWQTDTLLNEVLDNFPSIERQAAVTLLKVSPLLLGKS